MYGYRDYNGPKVVTAATKASSPQDDVALTQKQDHDDDMNPLQAGFWMEGDSMAPPCGTSISTIHKILEYLQLDANNDILYDLGCGDGRVCLEAWYQYKCKAIGVEVEGDLARRFQTLIGNLLSELDYHSSIKNFPSMHCMDLREVLHLWAKINYDAPDNDDDDGNTKYKHKFPFPTIIFLYLLPEALLEIKKSLLKILKKAPNQNCRIVCNTWGIPGWKPIQETTIPEATAVGVSTTFYVYTAASFARKGA